MTRRSDGRWMHQITVNGKRKSFYGKTQKEVYAQIAAFREQISKAPAFSRVAEEWDAAHAEQVSYNGAHAYDAALRRAESHFDGRRVDDITPAEIEAFVSSVAAEGYARRTVQLYRDMMHQIFRHAVLSGHCTSNPATDIPLPKGLPEESREPPTDEELAIIKAADAPFADFARCLLWSGLRRGELLALRREDVREDGIHVERAVYYMGNTAQIKEPKTKAGTRIAPLLPQFTAAMPERESGYLFSDDGGKTPLTKIKVRKRWAAYCKSAGLVDADGEPSVTPHQLRHAYATMLYDAGVDVKDAQYILGHSSIKVTLDIYTHISQRRRQSTAQTIAAKLASL